MRARRLHIHLRLPVRPVLLASPQDGQAVYLALNNVLGEPVDIDALGTVFSDEERLFAASILKQVINLLVVNLDEAAIDSDILWRLFKEELDTAWNDSSGL